MRGMLSDSHIKRTILERLRESPASGEELAKILGVSRVAVWKHIRELNELGYEIKPSNKGYVFVSEPHIPYPWELPVRAYYLPKTTSTMDVAHKIADKVPPDTFVIAGEQTGGRGRRGRRWVSKPGGLYFSMICRPKIPLAKVEKLMNPSVRAIGGVLKGLGLEVEASEEGIFSEGRKLGGVLVEATGELDLVRYAVVGVGLNVFNQVPDGAVSLSQLLPAPPNLLELSRLLLPRLLEECKSFLGGSVREGR
ncbi:MAG: BirA family transcriptional regulator [Thermococcaceae archaeon]|nr:BirA family transcriptional regulator [Thermococcaceae archaeon]MDK2913387.1 BirA family transcriptional regulator [Thermococcaceae archaeon]